MSTQRGILRFWSVLAIASVLGGCSVIATHEEYGAYRAVRTANNERDQLIAMQQYVEHHPSGYWIDAVQEQRREHEEGLWANSNTTREGLEWYLRVYPDGQFVDQARPRLHALQTVSSRRDEEAAHQAELEAERLRQAAEARRTWVSRAVGFWTHTLLSINNYGSTIQRVVGANPEFSRAFGQAPPPECSAEFCIKHYGQLYHIPVPGATRIDRHIDVYLRLVLDHGRVERAELLLPNKGFSRWYEMENQTVITDEDPEQRMTALNWALERIQPIITEVAAGAQPIDFVPEPIVPLQVSGEQHDTEAAPAAPDQAVEDQPAQQQQQVRPPTTGDSAIDDLLLGAGGSGEDANPTPHPSPQDVTPSETLVLPIGLMAFRHRNMRVVVFAAGDDDYDQAYDGIFLERARD